MHSSRSRAHISQRQTCHFSGEGKIFVDVVVYGYSENISMAKECLKKWAGDGVMPQEFYVDLALGLLGKKDTPHYQVDKTQYHVRALSIWRAEGSRVTLMIKGPLIIKTTFNY